MSLLGGKRLESKTPTCPRHYHPAEHTGAHLLGVVPNAVVAGTLLHAQSLGGVPAAAPRIRDVLPVRLGRCTQLQARYPSTLSKWAYRPAIEVLCRHQGHDLQGAVHANSKPLLRSMDCLACAVAAGVANDLQASP